MTIVEILLLALLGAAVVAIIVLSRRPAPVSDDSALRSELARVADALARQGADGRELRGDLGRIRELTEGLRAAADARQRAEAPVWDAVRRVESVLLGASKRGQAAENILEETLSLLPPGLLVRDFAIGGRRVEFALVLPDGRRMPIDSKAVAARELEELEAEADPDRRRALCRRVEDEVGRRTREVEGYVDDALTTPFAVACVPDAAFAVCRKAHADAFARRVILAPYSNAVPLLLALYALASRYGSGGDVGACLSELEGLLLGMEQTLENKVARATTMLQNASDEWRTQVGRARGALSRGRGTASFDAAQAELLPETVKVNGART